jgi:hypothetical protein
MNKKKEGISLLKFPLSEVFPNGLNSKKFIDDLKKIAKLDTLVNSEPLSRDFKLRYKRCYTSQERRDKPLTQVWAENGFTKKKND